METTIMGLGFRVFMYCLSRNSCRCNRCPKVHNVRGLGLSHGLRLPGTFSGRSANLAGLLLMNSN